MKYSKVHSLGNDFLIFDEEENTPTFEMNSLARRICERHSGIGADGLLSISVKDKDKGLVNFRIFNADGTEAEVSGNGLRCAAAYLYCKKKIDIPQILFKTTVGERESKLINRDNNIFQIKIEMGVPHLHPDDIPFDDGSKLEKVLDYPLSINQKIYHITAVSIGNPHCSIFIDRYPSRFEWHQIGREIELHPFFPKKTNVEFIRVHSRSEIEVLFWERGVGETLSSGSGASASAVASILKGLTDKKVNVRTQLGYLTVEWEEEKIYQTGPAEVIATGDFLSVCPPLPLD